ncbi:MAG: ATP phosphoribosyltransferase regulatory subunit [Anderseniella sp.]|jgi:ATP phosphoribosyltransferase regulatory subunit|nr:ATP phosphoribosyltransferase regulatory subunit [Anderseniella sp.]
MPGKSNQQRLALDALNAAMLPVLEAAGAEFIDPDIIQPADVFLERSGEHIRSRTYLFTSPDGEELCLRPDLTVPACRYHLETAADPAQPARYCYAGKAFRHTPGETGTAPVREFDQVGLEVFGAGDTARDDAEVLALTLAALQAAGVSGYRIEIGDLGLFDALLHSIDMPERWRNRLKRQFWRPRAFRDLLRQLSAGKRKTRTAISGLLDEMEESRLDPVAFVERHLEAMDLQMIAGRTVEQVAGRLTEKLMDRSQPPLTAEQAGLIDDYLAIRCSPPEAVERLHAIEARTGAVFAGAVNLFEARIDEMMAAGLDVDGMEFAAVFGRSLEYYTGFVFQIEQDGPDGASLNIAGGGRYDTMLADIGSGAQIPAVGLAIQASRLLDVAGGGA